MVCTNTHQPPPLPFPSMRVHFSGSICPKNTLLELERTSVSLLVWVLSHSLPALTYAFRLKEASSL